MDREKRMEVLLIGLDAGCHRVLDPLFEADAVPHLQSIFEDGVSGALESQIPPWTPSAWPSLYTGVNPGKHGAFGFLTFDGYDWDVVNASHVRARTLWETLDYHGKSSVVVNVPVTHPPREIDGAVVPGYTAPENPACHPEGVLDEIRDEIGEYRVYPPDDADNDVRWYRRLVEMRGEAFRYLADRFDPAFGFVEFQQTDTVFHERPGDQSAVRAVYEAVDDQIGAILEQCDPETVLVASDHGMGPYSGHEFRVNELLRERGYVKTARGEGGMPSWSTLADEQKAGGTTDADDSTLVEQALAAGAKVGLTSQRLGAVLEKAGLAEFVIDYVPESAVQAATEQVDFPASPAYMRSRIELGVRINLAGREPNGVVPESKYEQVRENLISLLSSVRTPDGDLVFERVGPREEFFHGPHVEDAVDVVTVPAEFDQFLSSSLRGEQFGPPSEPYNHKRDGIVAATGAGVDTDAEPTDAHLFDVTPTVLAAMDLPAGERMDGDALPFVEPVGTRSYPEFDPDNRTDTDDESVEKRLSDLGYLE